MTEILRKKLENGILYRKLFFSTVRIPIIGMNLPQKILVSNFPACFQIPIFFSKLNFNCSNFLDLRNLQEQVKKALCYQKLFWSFTVWINCSSDNKIVANSWPSASNFKSFSRIILVTKYHFWGIFGSSYITNHKCTANILSNFICSF